MLLSIIIPTKDRQQILQESIAHALEAIHGKDAEIIVVNDGEPITNLLINEKIHLIENHQRGVSVARNAGASAAVSDILFFIDDDMWVTKDSVEAIESLHKQSYFEDRCAILNWQYPESLMKVMTREKIGRYLLKVDFHTLEGRLSYRIEKDKLLMPVAAIGSGSFAIGRKLFETIGRYDETIRFQGEDTELSKRLNQHHVPIYLYTPVTCYHNQKDRLDIEGFLDREFRGYLSQFQNKKINTVPNRIKQLIFTFLMPFNVLFLICFRIIPNRSIFDALSFRIIGILSSIVYFKAWYQRNIY